MSGAKLAVTLRVEKGGSWASAQPDGEEDYGDLVRKWVEAIPWWVQQKQAPSSIVTATHDGEFPPELPKRRRLRIADILGTTFVIAWILVTTIYALSALVGLVTGELKLPSKSSGDLVTMQGWVARIVSVIILAFYGLIVSSIWKWRKQHKGKPWF